MKMKMTARARLTPWANISRTMSDWEVFDMSDRPCTCHPDDNPPVPCPQKYALIECREAADKGSLADEIERLLARCAELETHACGVRCPNCDNLRLELGEQRRRATELARDAARYRWLANSPYDAFRNAWLAWTGEGGSDGFTAAIDAAMESKP